MKILGIIPARFASTRFPGKPLADISGKTMIRRVYEQANRSIKLDEIIIATDDVRIADEVTSFGGRFLMTSPLHQSGTDRCAEVANQIKGYDAVINIQGDEPFIDPEQINLLASCFEQEGTAIATLIKKVTEEEDLFNQNIPKVVISSSGEALYFSRHPIPFIRNAGKGLWLSKHLFYKHIGIYGYLTKVLEEITSLEVSELEKAEQLEQLRWIENGYKIQTRVTSVESAAVDTPEDLEKIKIRFL